MAKISSRQLLLPSVLDRLIDDSPGDTREAARSRAQVLRELKQSVRRDLENLLNTRWRPTGWPGDLAELERSLVGYGIPDITAAELAQPGSREDFRRTIEALIRRFEPRFKSVRVEIRTNAEPLDRTLRFRVDAVLYAEPAPEPVSFDSAVEPATGTVEVKGAADGR